MRKRFQIDRVRPIKRVKKIKLKLINRIFVAFLKISFREGISCSASKMKTIGMKK